MFQCRDLLSLITMSQAKVIAGTGGMKRVIRWAYKAENINFEKWIHGQELLIVSSPVTQRRNFDLYKIIKKAIESNMSCALLLIGENYVSEIEKKVIQLADENNFPLFTIPWDVPLLDFFEELGHAISYLDDRKDIQDNLLADIIFGNTVNQHNIEVKCERIGCDISTLEQVFVMHINMLSNDEIRSYSSVLNDIFKDKGHPALVSCYGDIIIGFMKECDEKRELIKEIFKEFNEFIEKEHKGIEYTLNIGKKCDTLQNLQKSFHETSRINSILEHINRKKEIVFYDQMGFYRFLMSYENQVPMQKFVNEILGEIIEYDKKNNAQLLDTMWIYFNCDCNMTKAAERIFSHKNTIKYRLKRIEEITGRDFDNSFESLELFNALIIHYYLN